MNVFLILICAGFGEFVRIFLEVLFVNVSEDFYLIRVALVVKVGRVFGFLLDFCEAVCGIINIIIVFYKISVLKYRGGYLIEDGKYFVWFVEVSCFRDLFFVLCLIVFIIYVIFRCIKVFFV